MDNKLIEQYLEDSSASFDRILESGERKRHDRIAVLVGAAVAACIALVLWLGPMRPASNNSLTPVQIAEGIQQMMLLDIGDIESIEATPALYLRPTLKTETHVPIFLSAMTKKVPLRSLHIQTTNSN